MSLSPLDVDEGQVWIETCSGFSFEVMDVDWERVVLRGADDAYEVWGLQQFLDEFRLDG